MINKTQFAQMAKQVLRGGRGVKGQKSINPYRDWEIGIFISIFIFIISCTWSVVKYSEYKEIANEDREQSFENVTVYRDSVVKTALSSFEERASTHATLIGNQPIYEEPDPPTSEAGTNLEGQSTTTTDQAESTDATPPSEDLEQI